VIRSGGLSRCETFGRIVMGLTLVLLANVCQAQSVSFTEDLLPVFKRNCLACHVTGEEQGRLALVPGKAYASLVGVPALYGSLARVEPGSPERSYLVHKLEGTHLDVAGRGTRMPMGFPPLEPQILESIKAWISAGALNN
jgi:hypothetical protein